MGQLKKFRSNPVSIHDATHVRSACGRGVRSIDARTRNASESAIEETNAYQGDCNLEYPWHALETVAFWMRGLAHVVMLPRLLTSRFAALCPTFDTLCSLVVYWKGLARAVTDSSCEGHVCPSGRIHVW